MSKYQVSSTERWRLRGDDRPAMSRHVVGGDGEGRGRWDERMPADAVSPETAWERGVGLEESVRRWFSGSTQRGPPDRCRVYGEYSEFDGWWTAIMPVYQSPRPVLVTAMRGSQLNSPARRSYIDVRAHHSDNGQEEP